MRSLKGTRSPAKYVAGGQRRMKISSYLKCHLLEPRSLLGVASAAAGRAEQLEPQQTPAISPGLYKTPEKCKVTLSLF